MLTKKSLLVTIAFALVLPVTVLSEIVRDDILIETSYNRDYWPNLIGPHLRSADTEISVLSGHRQYTVELGEQVLIPVWSATEQGNSVPISWMVENPTPFLFSSILDVRSRPRMKSNTIFSPSTLDSWNSVGAARIVGASATTGCERRSLKRGTEPGEITNNVSFSEIVDAPSAYICVQGLSLGEATITIGERIPTLRQNRNYPTIVWIDPGNYSINPKASIEISINIVEVSQPVSNRQIMEFAEIYGEKEGCSTNCPLSVRPLNRGGDVLACDSSIDVTWHLSHAYTLISATGCSVNYSVNQVPTSQELPYSSIFDIDAVVRQTREVDSSTNQPTEIVREVSAWTTLLPFTTSTRETQWVNAQCPSLLAPGMIFTCLIEARDASYNWPSDHNPDINNIGVNPHIEYLGMSSDQSNFACFKVKENGPDTREAVINGSIATGHRFASSLITISTDASRYILEPGCNVAPP